MALQGMTKQELEALKLRIEKEANMSAPEIMRRSLSTTAQPTPTLPSPVSDLR